MANYIKEYYEWMNLPENKNKVGKWVRMEYLNLMNSIEGESPFYFDERAADAFLRFVSSYCRQSKGKWAKHPVDFMLFQKAHWQAVYGIKWKSTKLRRFKEVHLFMARKNGKTTEIAPATIWNTMREPGAEVYCAATTFAQAYRLWDEVRLMINQDPALRDRFEKPKLRGPDNCPTITFMKDGIPSTFKVLSSNTKAQDSFNSSSAVIDEAHTQEREQYDLISQSMTARSEPLLFIPSTQGFVRGGLLDNLIEYDKKVIDGIVDDPSLLPLLYFMDGDTVEEQCAEMDMKPKTKSEKEQGFPDTWFKANPGLGVIKETDKLISNYEKQKSDLDMRPTVLTKDFNIVGTRRNQWLDAGEIEKARFGPYSPEEVGYNESDPKRKEFLERFKGTTVLAGFDLSQSGDFTAWATLLFDIEKSAIVILPKAWITEKFLRSYIAKAAKVPFDAWIKRGIVSVGGDEIMDYSLISDHCMEEFDRNGYEYAKIGYDPYNASYLVSDFVGKGFSEEYCLNKVRQGFITLGEPMRVFRDMLRAGRITCLNDPCFLWALSNVEMVEDRNGNMMPKKLGNNNGNKIDPFAAALNAFVKFAEDHNAYLP